MEARSLPPVVFQLFQDFSFSPALKKLFDANIQETQDQQRERGSVQGVWGGQTGTGSITSHRGGGL